MIVIPDDPIEVWKSRVHRFALHLMDEDFIIDPGSMRNTPNTIVTTHLYFEKLETEPSPRRKVAQQLRRSQERTHKRLVSGIQVLYASLLVSER